MTDADGERQEDAPPDPDDWRDRWALGCAVTAIVCPFLVFLSIPAWDSAAWEQLLPITCFAPAAAALGLGIAAIVLERMGRPLVLCLGVAAIGLSFLSAGLGMTWSVASIFHFPR